MAEQVSCDVFTFRLLEIKEINKMQTQLLANLAAGENVTYGQLSDDWYL